MIEHKLNVLFIGTDNSARSLLAESMLNQLGAGRFQAYSAGSQSKGMVDPLTLTTLEQLRFDHTGLSSKGWSEFVKDGAPTMDFVITVCDQAAGEIGPVWPGHPITAHWELSDPAAVVGSEEVQQRAFTKTALALKRRIEFLLSIPLSKLEKLAIQREVREIGTR